MKDIIINIMSIIGLLSGHIVFGTIGAMIIVIFLVKTLIWLDKTIK